MISKLSNNENKADRDRLYSIFASFCAGLFMTWPFVSNLDPWQGQSQVCSGSFHFRAHPKCEHRFVVGTIKFFADSKLFINS